MRAVRTAASLVDAARRAGMTVEQIDVVPAPVTGTPTISSRLSFDDPWAAAAFLQEQSDEDATDPVVRAWALSILDATARSIGEAPGPSMSGELQDAFAEAIHENVKSHVRFVHEPEETFQSARVTMSAGAGDCDDHAKLVYALARAGGLQAQLRFFEQDDQPIHVVAAIQGSDGDFHWAETTLDACYGEHPLSALERTSLGDESNPFVGMRGMGDVATPGDVLAYRSMWDPYVMGIVRALMACGGAFAQASAGQTPATPIAQNVFVVPPDSQTLGIYAASLEGDSAQLLAQWNAHAGMSDSDLVLQAGNVLQDFQKAVEDAGQLYAPQVRRYCPSVPLPEPPSVSVQKQIIARLQGLGVIAGGVLQLFGIGAGGALDTLGAVGSTAQGLTSLLTNPAAWIAVAVGLGAAVVLIKSE